MSSSIAAPTEPDTTFRHWKAGLGTTSPTVSPPGAGGGPPGGTTGGSRIVPGNAPRNVAGPVQGVVDVRPNGGAREGNMGAPGAAAGAFWNSCHRGCGVAKGAPGTIGIAPGAAAGAFWN